MPKLTIPQRTYGKAIGCLINLYKGEPGFIEELVKIRQVYEHTAIKWLDSSMPHWRQLKTLLTRSTDPFDGFATLTEETKKVLVQFSKAIRGFYEGLNVNEELIEYERKLSELACRWRLKAKWTGLALIVDHFLDIIGITQEDIWNTEGSVELVEPLLDEAPLPPLIFKVTAYELMYSDQQEIVREFSKNLSEYADSLKSQKWRELPSAIETHAFWWFECYVHKKPYKEIVEQHSPELTDHGIRKAVFNFRRLLGIELVPKT